MKGLKKRKRSITGKGKKYIRVLCIAALFILLAVILFITLKLKKNPELASPENIVKAVSSNRAVAIIEFVVLYVLKGISFVFPSTALSIASGIAFECSVLWEIIPK